MTYESMPNSETGIIPMCESPLTRAHGRHITDINPHSFTTSGLLALLTLTLTVRLSSRSWLDGSRNNNINPHSRIRAGRALTTLTLTQGDREASLRNIPYSFFWRKEASLRLISFIIHTGRHTQCTRTPPTHTGRHIQGVPLPTSLSGRHIQGVPSPYTPQGGI